MTDFAFLITLVAFTFLTPRASEYFKINMLLTGKFSLFIGIHYLLLRAGATDGPSTDIYRGMLDLVFALVFTWIAFHSKSKIIPLISSSLGGYLAFLCLVMAGFHFTNAIYQIDIIDYTLIMIGFQILQLMASAWGTIDGLYDRNRIHHSRFSTNIHKHS